MKKWTKIYLKDKNKDIELMADSLTNYLYGYGPIRDICRKYKIKPNDREILDKYTLNRIAGLLMLYLSNDKKRINDIINKYSIPNKTIEDIIPELEGYIDQ